jgi:hypothetical protein
LIRLLALSAVASCLWMGSGTVFAQDSKVDYGFKFVPPASGQSTPRIRLIELNSDRLHAHGPIAIRVSTTLDVVSVRVGRKALSGTLRQTAPGVFMTEATLPKIGLLFGGAHVKIHFEAKTATGETAAADVPVSYQ